MNALYEVVVVDRRTGKTVFHDRGPLTPAQAEGRRAELDAAYRDELFDVCVQHVAEDTLLGVAVPDHFAGDDQGDGVQL
jgi:hypothetical protein